MAGWFMVPVLLEKEGNMLLVTYVVLNFGVIPTPVYSFTQIQLIGWHCHVCGGRGL